MVPFIMEVPDIWGGGQVEVAPDILRYCDAVTVDAERDDIRYLDCLWENHGYYGTPPHIMKAVRDEYFRNPPPSLPVYPAFECEYGCNNDGLTEQVEAQLDEVWPDEKNLPPFMPRQRVPIYVQEGSMDPYIPTDKLNLNLGEEQPL